MLNSASDMQINTSTFQVLQQAIARLANVLLKVHVYMHLNAATITNQVDDLLQK